MGGWRRSPNRLGAVTLGYKVPLKLALAVKETAAGHMLSARAGGGGGAPPLPIHPWGPACRGQGFGGEGGVHLVDLADLGRPTHPPTHTHPSIHPEMHSKRVGGGGLEPKRLCTENGPKQFPSVNFTFSHDRTCVRRTRGSTPPPPTPPPLSKLHKSTELIWSLALL